MDTDGCAEYIKTNDGHSLKALKLESLNVHFAASALSPD